MITSAGATFPLRILVVRDRERDAIRNPPPEEFSAAHDVSYQHLADVERVPAVDHLVLNCAQVTWRIHELIEQAHGDGVPTTVISRHVDRRLAALAEQRTVNVIPAYGSTDQITAGTLRRSLAMAIEGARVIASGFVRNSIAGPEGLRSIGQAAPFFMRTLQEISAMANAGTSVVAAVLAQQRTGSKFLHDLIGWTISGRARLFHEHAVPEPPSVDIDDNRPLFDQVILERDERRRAALRQAIRRRVLIDSERRFIFVTEREPRARLTSYFLMHRKAALRQAFDAERATFRDLAAIQSDFDRFVRAGAESQRHWYTFQLTQPFALDVLSTRHTDDGLLVGESGPNTLVIVPIERLNALVAELAMEYGESAYVPLHENSAQLRGDEAIAAAFNAHVRFDQRAADRLLLFPEVARIHQAAAVRR